ncbi:hypothetical protein BRE01_14630 [Brevibacillus reuszeri]|uniref:Glycosyl transferase n=1 Tax=Brevibacillus reuszeri TaxID=54915 RepID=A0ABQ0TIR8_9BACL|nr:glycosyltransferase family 4 protein [Brevibacillus reuszeri]MED1856540.1 glycosyltransferase family 4 protein [Brevibacillus reuszeri]GED67761.1 hypothetical protein BRE01_14630 [Brevibacillus reuszeri]
MKVLIAYCYSLPHVGGIWTYVEELKRSLEKKGHSVSILAADQNEKNYYLLDSDQSVRIATISDMVKKVVHNYYEKHWNEPKSWLLSKETFRYNFELAAAYFGLEQYDLIHTHDSESTRAISRVKPKHIPLISTFHCSNTRETFVLQERAPRTFKWKYVAAEESLAVKAADRLIVPSNWLKSTLVDDYHPTKERIHVIPHGIDIELFKQRMKQPPPLERRDGLFHIVCVARLAREKGHELLLKALAKLAKERKDWVCWLVGDGYMRKKLIEQRNRLQLQQQVMFVGAQENVPSILKQADMFVLPSFLETLGFAVMEAQLAGLPIAVTNAGGMPEVVTHMETGLLSPVAASGPLYRNIKQIMDDHDLANRLSGKAQRWGREQWPIELMVRRTLELYQQTLEAGANQQTESYTAPKAKRSVSQAKPFVSVYKRYAKKAKQPEVWKAILASLPRDYTIPDMQLVREISRHAR